ncbi:uncharacterized protein LOC116166181 [Photinus pyralis]|uniref:uncharacterized protein LOC116166181 n=1 Tax=Photinus pyralis TaxID=7054 RepID=UPI001267470C|nr:uncharacterized protein LOC116166181 [Photinus pyralis]
MTCGALTVNWQVCCLYTLEAGYLVHQLNEGKGIKAAFIQNKAKWHKHYVEPVELFPTINFECAGFITDNYHTEEQKSEYIAKVKQYFNIGPENGAKNSLCSGNETENLSVTKSNVVTLKDVINQKQDISDVESTFDDSDKDKDYEPRCSTSSESDSEVERQTVSSNTEKKRRRLIKKIKKLPLANLESKFNIEVVAKRKKSNNSNIMSTSLQQANCNTIITSCEEATIKKQGTENILQKAHCCKNTIAPDNTSSEKCLENIQNPASSNNIEHFEEPNNKTKKVAKKLTRDQKEKRDKSKHPLREKCKNLCRRKCAELDEDTRTVIWNYYWSMDYTSRRKWLSINMLL